MKLFTVLNVVTLSVVMLSVVMCVCVCVCVCVCMYVCDNDLMQFLLILLGFMVIDNCYELLKKVALLPKLKLFSDQNELAY